MLRRWGPRQCQATCVPLNLLFRQLCRTKSQRQCPKKQLLRNNPAARQSIRLWKPSSTSLFFVFSPGLIISAGEKRDFQCCLTSTEARRPIRDGDEWEKGGQKSETSKQAPTRKTKVAVDRRQNENVKAVSIRSCAVTTAPRNCCPKCYAEQSHKDNVRSSAVGKQLKQKKSNSQAQLHLPPWALRVQE